jgi:hypothetical protein
MPRCAKMNDSGPYFMCNDGSVRNVLHRHVDGVTSALGHHAIVKFSTVKVTKSTKRCDLTRPHPLKHIGTLFHLYFGDCVRQLWPFRDFANTTFWIDRDDIGKGNGGHCPTARASCEQRSARCDNVAPMVRGSKL